MSETRTVTAAMVDFASRTRYEDLPREVVHEAKRLLLDSMGVAFGGLLVDKGRLSVKVAKRLGGPAESTVIGTGDKVASPNAAFANGELVNALDMDSTTPPGHVAPYVLPACLASAECARASGKDLIAAIAIAQEFGTRLGRALGWAHGRVKEEGNLRSVYSPVHGYSWSTLGAAAGVAKILQLDRGKMCHAVGIAGYMAPGLVQGKFAMTSPVSMTKYGSAGGICQIGVTAALLAETGYTGDATVLDTEYGYWRFSGSEKWDPEGMVKGLGKVWDFVGSTNYKLYPCCGAMHIGLQLFEEIMQENDLVPEGIEEVRVITGPTAEMPPFANREIKTHVDAQFSMPYCYSVVAHRIRAGADWQDSATFRNPGVLGFMNRVKMFRHDKYDSIQAEQPREGAFVSASGYPTIIEVIAKGKKIRKEGMFTKGRGFPESYRLTDSELVEKFRNQSSRCLAEARADELARNILALEEAADVSELMKLTY